MWIMKWRWIYSLKKKKSWWQLINDVLDIVLVLCVMEQIGLDLGLSTEQITV